MDPTLILGIVMGIVVIFIVAWMVVSFLNQLALRKLIKQYNEKDDLSKKGEQRRRAQGGIPIAKAIKRAGNRKQRSESDNESQGLIDLQREIVGSLGDDGGSTTTEQRDSKKTHRSSRRSTRRRRRRR